MLPRPTENISTKVCHILLFWLHKVWYPTFVIQIYEGKSLDQESQKYPRDVRNRYKQMDLRLLQE
jgi:hypothetical protein